MLRFSANLSLLFTEYAWPERFKVVRQYGFQAVEIQFPYFMPAEEILKYLNQAGLKLVLFNVAADDLLQGGEGLAAVPEKQLQFRQAVAKAMDYARILQPEAINVLPGRCVQPSRLDSYLSTFKENLNFAAEEFAALCIKTVFEAINIVYMPDFIIYNSQQMLQVLAEVGHPMLAMQYDIYHMAMMAEDCYSFLRQYQDKIGHIQFADSPGRGQPGTGMIDFGTLFTLIQNSAYAGWVGAEYRPVGESVSSLDWAKSWIS